MGLKVNKEHDGRMPAVEMVDDGTLYEVVIWPGFGKFVGLVAQRIDKALHFAGEPPRNQHTLFFTGHVSKNIFVRPLPSGTPLETT